MFGISDYGAFVAAIVLFLAIPRPGNLALITSTGKGGVRAGLAAACGVIAADQLLMWTAVAGVAALLATYPAAFHAVQWLGAAYLAWLGWKMLSARPGDAPVLRMPEIVWRAGIDLDPLDADEARATTARWQRAVELLGSGTPVLDPEPETLVARSSAYTLSRELTRAGLLRLRGRADRVGELRARQRALAARVDAAVRRASAGA